MQTLITTSGFTMIPPSGLSIVFKSLELSCLTSGTISVSGSASGTVNTTLNFDGSDTVPMEWVFPQNSNVTVTPSTGTMLVNYITAGEPEAFKYAAGVSWYSKTPPLEAYHKRWVGSTSGTYQPVSGGFGG
jgi:hypothetical protein